MVAPHSDDPAAPGELSAREAHLDNQVETPLEASSAELEAALPAGSIDNLPAPVAFVELSSEERALEERPTHTRSHVCFRNERAVHSQPAFSQREDSILCFDVDRETRRGQKIVKSTYVRKSVM